MRDAGLAVADGRLGGLVAEVLGAHAVHADAADEGALATSFAYVGEEVGGGDVEGGVVGAAGGAVAEGAAYDAVVDGLGAVERAEAGFHGEGVSAEPGEEGAGAEDAGVGVLWGMGVGIDEAGKEEAIFGGGDAVGRVRREVVL